MKRKLKAIMLTTLSFTLAACGGNSGGKNDGKTATFAKENDVISMDSRLTSDGMSFEMIAATTDGLLATDKDGNVIPSLAESFETSSDKLTYTFKLRDAKWSNGDEITAEDFVYAWQATVSEEAAPYNYLYTEEGASIENAEDIIAQKKDKSELGVKAIDKKTLEVKLSKPVSFFDSLMTFPAFFPLNQKFIEEQGDQYALTPENLVASGPYKMETWEKGSKIVLVKNESYWDAENIKMDSLTFNIVPEASTAVLDFEAGTSDYVRLNSDLVDKYKDNEAYVNVLEGYLWYLQFNFNNEVLKNENVRKAIALSVDKNQLANAVLKDGSIAAQGFVPSELATGPDGKDYRETADTYLATNKEEAKKYWEKAKQELGKDSITLRLLFESSDPAKPAAEFILSELSALDGLTIEMISQPKDNRLQMQKSNDFDVVLTRWGPDFADPTTYLALMKTGNTYNFGKYSSVTYDAAYEIASNETDTTKRWQLLKDAEGIIMEETAIAPMFQVGGATLQNPKMKGVEAHTVGVPFIYRNVDIEE